MREEAVCCPTVPRLAGAPAAPLTYAYLVSAAHSGSTLLACLLQAHPQVSSVGEFGSDVGGQGRCSCGKNYANCEFWLDWSDRARAAGIPFDIGRLDINLEPRPGAGLWDSLYYHQFPWRPLNRLRDLAFMAGNARNRRAAEAIDRSVRLAALLCQMQNTRVFLDTTKNFYQLRFLARHPGIRLKAIALVRDGRGVMNSLIRREKMTREQAVSTWLWANRNIDRALSHYMRPGDVFRLRLVDLCRDPQGVLRSLLEFLKVDPRAELDCSDTHNRHLIGNSMRYSFQGQLELDESWQQKLSADDLAYFAAHGGWLNRRLGYSERPDHTLDEVVHLPPHFLSRAG